MRRPATLAATLLATAVALLACSKPAPAPEPLRAVKTIVVEPASAGGSFDYAGEIRARVESKLSFRVAGKVLERSVDPGAVVRAGPGARAPRRARPAPRPGCGARRRRQRRGEPAAGRGGFQALSRPARPGLHQRRRARAARDRRSRSHARSSSRRARSRACRATRPRTRRWSPMRAASSPASTSSREWSSPPARRCCAWPTTARATSSSRCPRTRSRRCRRSPRAAAASRSGSGARPAPRSAARLREVAASAEPMTRTYLVKADLSGADLPTLRLGQTATVSVAAPRREGVAARAALGAARRPRPQHRLGRRPGDDDRGRARGEGRRRGRQRRRRRRRSRRRRPRRHRRRPRPQPGPEGAPVRRSRGADGRRSPRRRRARDERRRALGAGRRAGSRRSVGPRPREALVQHLALGARASRVDALPARRPARARLRGVLPARPGRGPAVHLPRDGDPRLLAGRDGAAGRRAGHRQAREDAAGSALRRPHPQLLQAGRGADPVPGARLVAAEGDAADLVHGEEEDRRHARHAALRA